MRPRVIGLTGQTGAGKSTVAAYFRRMGAEVIDCDLAARKVVEPGAPALLRARQLFGQGILRADGTLDRAAVAELVFSDPEKLKRWCDILYPAITEYIEGRLRELSGTPAVILDAPTLFESGADRLCDAVVSVVAPEKRRLKRIMARDGIGREAALRRMSAQPEEAFYTGRSQAVIVNDGSPEYLKEQVESLKALLP